jgi:hypothetical protein
MVRAAQERDREVRQRLTFGGYSPKPTEQELLEQRAWGLARKRLRCE